MKKSAWFRFEAQAEDPSVVDIHIIDFIGDWIDQWIKDVWGDDTPVTAKAFVERLAQLPEDVKTLRVHINSPGGDVFGALNIANALREQRASKGRTVETVVDGLAASAASIIAMAGAPVRVSDNALFMVHDPWTVAVGNAADMAKAIEQLDKVRDTIVSTYQWHSELGDEALRALMAAETWMDADEAVERGFADEKVEGLQAAASIDPRAAAKLKVPEQYAARVSALTRAGTPETEQRPAPTPQPHAADAADAADVVKLCGDAGLDLDFAQALIAEGLTAADVEARITAERESRLRAAAREKEIRAVCEVAKVDSLSDRLVRSGMTVEDVRAHVTEVTGMLDKVEIDSGLSPDAGSTRRSPINVVEVYAERNRLALPAKKKE